MTYRLFKKQTSIHILKDYMFLKTITILEYDGLVCNASYNNKPHLQVFRLNQNNEKLVSVEEESR